MKLLTTLIFTGFFTFSISSVAMTAPIVNPENGHFYEAIGGDYTWDEATVIVQNSIFKGMQGYLASLTTQSENYWVWSNLGPLSGYLLGGTDIVTEGIWEWVSGETWVYENWNSGEPNNYNGGGHVDGEDALQFGSDGTWNDVFMSGTYSGGSSSRNGFIVEYFPVPIPGAIYLLGFGLLGLVGIRQKKK